MAFPLFDLTAVAPSSPDFARHWVAIARGLAEHGAEIVLNGCYAEKLADAAARPEGRFHKVATSCFREGVLDMVPLGRCRLVTTRRRAQDWP